jgi:hypothetical protein
MPLTSADADACVQLAWLYGEGKIRGQLEKTVAEIDTVARLTPNVEGRNEASVVGPWLEHNLELHGALHPFDVSEHTAKREERADFLGL